MVCSSIKTGTPSSTVRVMIHKNGHYIPRTQWLLNSEHMIMIITYPELWRRWWADWLMVIREQKLEEKRKWTVEIILMTRENFLQHLPIARCNLIDCNLIDCNLLACNLIHCITVICLYIRVIYRLIYWLINRLADWSIESIDWLIDRTCEEDGWVRWW